MKFSFSKKKEKLDLKGKHSSHTSDIELLKRPHFSFRLNILLGFILFSLLSMALLISSVISINQIQKKFYFIQTAERYLFEIEQARIWEKNHFLYGTNLADALRNADNATTLLSQNKNLVVALKQEQTEAMKVNLNQYRSLLNELIILEKNIDVNTNTNTNKKSELESLLREYGAKIVNIANKMVYEKRNSMNVMLDMIHNIPIYFFIVLLLLSFMVARFLTQRLIIPLDHLVKCTQRIAHGDFSPLVPIRKYRDEFTDVEVAVNQMLKQLKSREVAMIESHKLRAIGTLTAGVAHELNNPLNNIMLTAHAMLEDYKHCSKDELYEMINDLINEAERSRKIIRNLLDFSREGESISEPIDLEIIVNETIKLAKNQIKLSKAKLEIQIKPHLPRTRGDQQQLKQVFLNLILNALDAIGEKEGIIKISLEKSESPGFVSVNVEDNGSGIPPYILPNIFDPFFSTKKSKGTGLGLSVAHGIVKMHGGKINIKTEPGKYSRFTVILPALNDPCRF